MNDTQDKIGKLLQPGEERDAIHIAVLPVVAEHELEPGQHVGVARRGGGEWLARGLTPLVGIIDPFLKERKVRQGQRCWVFLYPLTVTSIKHEWTLDAIDGTSEQRTSRDWLERFADRTAIDIDELIDGMSKAEEVCFGTDDGPEEARYSDELWYHVSVVTGKLFTPEHKESTHFRCAC